MEDSVKTTTEDVLSVVKQQFKDAYDSSIDSRAEAELSRDYYDGKQWTAAEIETLKKRKQPVITDNRIKDKVEYLLGLERRTRTDPKAYPRNPSDEESAEGLGGCEIVWEDEEVKIRRIRWDRLYFDPRSQERDFKDVAYVGVVTWMDQNRAASRWPDKKDLFESMFEEATKTTGGDTYDDKPSMWIDGKRRRVQIMEHYRWDGKWKRSVYCGGGFLEDETDSPYKDEHGRPDCPIILQAAYRDREGD